MIKELVHPAQLNSQSFGTLEVNVTSSVGFKPIEDATINISYTGDPGNTIEQIKTNSLGQIKPIELKAPSIEYSMEPSPIQPYSEYTFEISSPGFETIYISGAQILPEVIALQNVQMIPLASPTSELVESFVIPPHTLFGDFPPKIAEDEIKPLDETGEIVLSRVVIPEYIIVHDGPPTDATAKNHYVKYKDYIKNVASSEIYATWPESTIQANVLAILSFTLNRVFTEWYRNKGYNFTITSSTAFDHKWMSGRNIYDNISTAVDTIFSNFLSRPNVTQPILTQYCDGYKVKCPNWMTQWGSKDLGDQNYTPISILRYFYGDNMFINTAAEVSGVPSSWPGANLTLGSSGEKVRQMQNQLNTISNNYPLIPKIVADGVFGPKTVASVKIFQDVFGLPSTGIVDFPTWYKISEIYVAVSRIAELV